MNRPGFGFLFAGVISLLLTATPSWAQADFRDLKIQSGDLVYVTPSSGATVSGRVTAVSPERLAVDGREFRPEPGLTIARSGDSLWNGFLIGFAIGSVAGPTIGAEACPERKIGCVIGGGLTYAGIGMLIDWRIKGRRVIYRAPRPGAATLRVVPDITGRTKAFGMSVSF